MYIKTYSVCSLAQHRYSSGIAEEHGIATSQPRRSSFREIETTVVDFVKSSRLAQYLDYDQVLPGLALAPYISIGRIIHL